MLAGLRQRIRDGRGLPEPKWPDTDGPRLIAMARHDPASQTVSIILDATTANIAIYAITNHAVDREAHTAKSRNTARNSPRTLIASAPVRLSPPGKPESRNASALSNVLTIRLSTTTRYQRRSPRK
jgi:hypothetical protein